MNLNPLHFSLVRMSLLQLATPIEFEHTKGAIVVRANAEGLGATSTGFVPDKIIVQGAQTRKEMMANSAIRAWVWAAKDLSINADDKMSCSELMSMLQELLYEKYRGNFQNDFSSIQPSPYVVQVYPFENYMVFTLKGISYRQYYVIDPLARKVALAGLPTKVQEMFIDAAGDSKQYMMRVDTGVRYAVAPPMGNSQSTTTGARNSELATCIIRNYNDINARVDQYLAVIKNGAYKSITPNFDPAMLGTNGRVYGVSNVMASVYKRGVNAFDFARYLVEKAENKKRKVM